ncbi:MAG: lipid-A-disaccharide synthase [Candidatus Omnitrophica bacterium]|nr:lipid-A-disaccharide synthase [Candidatus Omnitrophota bacterium]
MSPKKILIVSGEPSGDLHAANLVKELKGLDPDLEFFGLGGTLSKDAGVDVIFDISALALVGAVEVVKNISTVNKAYRTVLDRIDSTKPDLAILVDYPGFNLKLARELKKRNIRIAYYISPQIWAWGMSRIKTIKECVSKMVVFFKFEDALYKRHGVDSVFVGHPLLDSVKVTLPKKETLKKYGLAEDKITIALLPGSRRLEVAGLLGIMVSSCKIIKWALERTQFIVAKHPDLPMEIYKNIMDNSRLDIRIADGDTHNILAASDFAIVASGTATLETAIIGTPFIIIYKANFFSYIIYKVVARIKFLGLVNIIAGRGIIPELLQYNAKPRLIAQTALTILSGPDKQNSMRKSLKDVAASLGSRGASARAAAAILSLLR